MHGEGPGGGDAATLCGKGADYIAATDEAVTCKTCIKVAAKAAEEAMLVKVNQPSSERLAAIMPHAEATVIITGSRVHAEGVPCGTVYDDDLVSGVDTDASADCHACLSQPTERIAGDGSVIRVGSRVIVAAEGMSDGSTPEGTVTSLADYADGEWVELVTVKLATDGLPYGFSAMNLATVIDAVPQSESERRIAEDLADIGPGEAAYVSLVGNPETDMARVEIMAYDASELHVRLSDAWYQSIVDGYYTGHHALEDPNYITSRVAEINKAAGVTVSAERSVRWSRRNGGKGRKTRAGGRKGRRS